MLELIKLVVQPVIATREDGTVVDEQVGQTAALYTQEQVIEYFQTLESELARLNESADESAEEPAE